MFFLRNLHEERMKKGEVRDTEDDSTRVRIAGRGVICVEQKARGRALGGRDGVGGTESVLKEGGDPRVQSSIASALQHSCCTKQKQRLPWVCNLTFARLTHHVL